MNNSTHIAVTSALLAATFIWMSSAACAQSNGNTSTGASPWLIDRKTSALDGKTTYVAGLMSTNHLTNSAGVEQPARLMIRCSPEGGLEAYIVWPIYMGNEAQTDVYRLDDQPVVKEPWIPGQTGASTFLQEDVRVFLGKLASAKRLVVQASGYRRIASEVVFDLNGVAEVAAAALQACL